MTNKLYADGIGPVYTYTPDGKLASRTWARGITTTYSYTNTGEMIEIDYSDTTPDVSYTYDRLGRQVTITDGQGTRSFTYNDYLQLAAETNVMGQLTRQYDSQGRPAGFEFWNGTTRAAASVYGYSGSGRFSSIVSSVQNTTNTWFYSYVPASDLLAGCSNEVLQITRSYEAHRNLLTQIKTVSGTNPVAQFDYASDAVGRRISRIDYADATNDFGYNQRSELITAAMKSNQYGYAYDPIGNRTAATNNIEILAYIANELNQYTNIADEVLEPGSNRIL